MSSPKRTAPALLVPLAAVALLLTGCLLHPEPETERLTVVCHDGRETLKLPEPAAQAHLDHGDTLGPCR